jgi:hypothetical protein
MKIVITAKIVRTSEYGNLVKDRIVEVPEHFAKFLIERGEAIRFETKEQMDRPTVTAGKVEPSSASPADQASPSPTLNSSEGGVKRRGRPAKASL